MVEDDVATLIVSDGLATLGGTLFIGPLPASPDLAISILPTVSAPPDAIFNESTPGMERPRVQIRVRGEAKDYSVPRILIECIYRALANRGGFTVNSTKYADLSPVQQPFPLGMDNNSRWVFAVNFEAWKEPSPLP